MEFLSEYGLFLAKAITLVVALLVVFGNLFSFGRESSEAKGSLKLIDLNERYQDQLDDMNEQLLSKDQLKKIKKDAKLKAKQDKEQAKKKEQVKEKESEETGKELKDSESKDQASSEQPAQSKVADSVEITEPTQSTADEENSADNDAGKVESRIFYLRFDGDVHASASEQLREEITAVLSVATTDDEIVVNIESPGGVVHGYGFASSQLARIRKANIKLTAVVDKVAASGGYMMASVADNIQAAPFAIIGSVGVVAQMPNFNKLLKKNHIDIELHTAGEHKRTLTTLGENTDEGRKKFREELQEVHQLFKNHIAEHRPSVDVDKIATGEYWFGTRAQELGLVDGIMTSDEYLMSKMEKHQIYQLVFEAKKTLKEKLTSSAEAVITNSMSKFWAQLNISRFF